MAALGEKLRREREARGVSVKEIAEATRIHENYLYALEENDYGSLPGAVFVTGFLRNYAAHLGLDADKIVIEFEAMKIEPPVKPRAVPGAVSEESSMSALWAVGALILLLVIYVAYVNWPGGASNKGKPVIDTVAEKAETAATDKIEPIEPEGEKVTAVPEADKAEPPVMKEPPPDTVEKKKPPAPEVTKKEPVPAAAGMVKPKNIKKAVRAQASDEAQKKKYKYWLVVYAHDEDAWILVIVDDVIVRDMFVRAGQRIIIKGNESFNFTTGKANQVSLTLNGKPLHFEIPKSNVLRSWDIPLPGAE
ncbi:MAG: RodZ domain-containing protein [Nitrospinota bacterium]